MANDNVRWTLTVSQETDLALWAYLGSQGKRKGDLSKFVEDAVRWRMFDENVQAVKARNADVDVDVLQAAIDETCASIRAGRAPGSVPPV